MSIMRSFTTRRKQPELDPNTPSFVGRAASQRGGRPVHRTQISSPMCLVSTTNMLSYNAPDIVGTAPIENRELTSGSSSEESDGSGNSTHSRETDPTDISSVEASPVSTEPESNHLSQYFKAATDNTASKPLRPGSAASRSPLFSESPSPALPRRAPSHSKHAHEVLSRKLSVERARSPVVRGRGVSRTRDSADMFNSMATAFVEAPKETVGQLGAVAEELENDSDASYLRRKGLAALSAADYCSEVDSLKAIYLYDNSPQIPSFSDWI